MARVLDPTKLRNRVAGFQVASFHDSCLPPMKPKRFGATTLMPNRIPERVSKITGQGIDQGRSYAIAHDFVGVCEHKKKQKVPASTMSRDE